LPDTPETGGVHAMRRLDWNQFGELCERFADEIAAGYRPDVVVGIAMGGVIVGAVIAARLKVDFFPIKLSRRVMAEVVQEEPVFHIKPYAYCEGKRVLLADDFAHSGQTLRIAGRAIGMFNPIDVKTAALYRDEAGYKPDFCAVSSDARLLLPWDYSGGAAPEGGE
jgi:hypothetical protein